MADHKNSNKLKELEVSFKVNFLPKSEATEATLNRMKKDDQIFGIQEIEIGREDFMVVMGRTVVVSHEPNKLK